MVLYNTKTTRPLFTNLKDKEDKKNQSNLVYQIFCKDCNKNYIGQTSQRIEKRISQHQLSCKDVKNKDKSSLAYHHHDLSHDFAFESYNILDLESNLDKRRISEMIHITMQQEKRINQRSDSDNLSTSYRNLIIMYKNGNG